MDKWIILVYKHAPLRKRSTRSSSAPCLDSKLRSLMLQRDKAKAVFQKSWSSVRKMYCTLRNKVTKLIIVKSVVILNRKSLTLWIMKKNCVKHWMYKCAKRQNPFPKFVECEGQFSTKPHDFANYSNNFLLQTKWIN